MVYPPSKCHVMADGMLRVSWFIYRDNNNNLLYHDHVPLNFLDRQIMTCYDDSHAGRVMR